MHWQRCGRLAMKLLVTIPLPSLTLRDLLSLEKGQLLLSTWSARDDVPLFAGDSFIANVTFEAAATQLGVRISSFQRKPHGQQTPIAPAAAKVTRRHAERHPLAGVVALRLEDHAAPGGARLDQRRRHHS